MTQIFVDEANEVEKELEAKGLKLEEEKPKKMTNGKQLKISQYVPPSKRKFKRMSNKPKMNNKKHTKSRKKDGKGRTNNVK